MLWKWIALLLLAFTACGPRKPQTYRLIPQGTGRVLVPPGVASAELARSVVTVVPGKAPCTSPGPAVTAQARRGRLRLTVTRAELLQQPPGWLKQWSADLEASGCGADLAARVLESLPLDPSAAFTLMHADSIRRGFVDLGPESRLQTTSPILKPGSTDAGAMEIASVTGQGAHLDVDVRSPDTLPGVETAWWVVRPKTGGGTTIVPLSAERSISGAIESAAAPLHNYFQFAPDIGYYRLIYKADLSQQGAVTEIVIGAPNGAELERRTERLLADFDTCRVSDPALCMVIPRHVALNPYVAITVNGKEFRVATRSTLRSALRAAGSTGPAEQMLPHLTVMKPYGGKLVPVEFDRSSPAVLDLTLLGGESISWTP